MHFWTGVTDNTWFSNLSAIPGIDEVNFWHPSGKPPFKGRPEGTPFLFKLKSPNNHVAGGGYLVKFERLPLRLAWEAFGAKNGARSYAELLQLILRARAGRASLDDDIGCSIIGEPFFLPRERWIPVPDVFSGNIVSGKFFDVAQPDGRRLWEQVEMARASTERPAVWSRPIPTHGDPVLVIPRRGQGAFRALVTNAYGRRCAITGESTLPVLEAAHIKPVSFDGQHHTFNGLLLRSDFHKLFDNGLVTVTPDHTIVVSERIKQQWYNGKAYSRLHGSKLAVLPVHASDRPNNDYLAWHNDNMFEKVL